MGGEGGVRVCERERASHLQQHCPRTGLQPRNSNVFCDAVTCFICGNSGDPKLLKLLEQARVSHEPDIVKIGYESEFETKGFSRILRKTT